MRIFGMGMPEMIVILLVILIIFGPKNLPKLGSALGKAVKGVREGVDSVNSELEAAKKSVDGETKDSEGAAAPVTATAVVEDAPVKEAPVKKVTVKEDEPAAEEAPAAGFCAQCGAALEADAKFCKKCGAATS
ncbi:MAG: twin-arginine translocase TatA/TatE family subunit [Coriobacteriia bacterium]|nr:twin-arginine translocase TatA/TatE family subunit [Coriobacteriia bacterium]